jgi:hypothetical protein
MGVLQHNSKPRVWSARHLGPTPVTQPSAVGRQLALQGRQQERL